MILQARTLEWVAISFSNAWKGKVKVKSLSCVRLFATPWSEAYRLLLPWDFPGKSTGVGCHCLLPFLSIFQFMLIFVWGTQYELKWVVYFECPIIPAPFVKNTIFSPFSCLGIFINCPCMWVSIFWTPLFFWYMSLCFCYSLTYSLIQSKIIAIFLSITSVLLHSRLVFLRVYYKMSLYIYFTKQCEMCLFLTWFLCVRRKRVIFFTNGTDYKKQWQNKLVFNVNLWELKFQLQSKSLLQSLLALHLTLLSSFPSVQLQLDWVLSDSVNQESTLKHWDLARLQSIKIHLYQ